MVDVKWNNWVFKRVQMKRWIHFYSHYQQNYRLMMRTSECTFDFCTDRHALTDSPVAMCGNMPPTILISCVNRGLAPLCLGLYHTKSQTEIVWAWSHQAEQIRSEGEDTSRSWKERRCLEGGRPEASLMFHRLGFGKEIFHVWTEEREGTCRWEERSQWRNKCIAVRRENCHCPGNSLKADYNVNKWSFANWRLVHHIQVIYNHS